MNQTGIFEGRTRVRYGYSCFGWTRGGGKTWHGGSDEEGLDSDRILIPPYYGQNAPPKSISGQVIQARMVLDRSNTTWEWGWYVTVKLDANQTPDEVNYFYFCHNAQNLVKIGQRVKTGDVIAVMGNTGNAALADPPFKHCHFEVRATATGTGLDPTAYTGHPNTPGTYGSNNDTDGSPDLSDVPNNQMDEIQLVSLAPLTDEQMRQVDALAEALGLTDSDRYSTVRVTEDTFAAIFSVSNGDALKVMDLAQQNGWDKLERYNSRFVG